LNWCAADVPVHGVEVMELFLRKAYISRTYFDNRLIPRITKQKASHIVVSSQSSVSGSSDNSSSSSASLPRRIRVAFVLHVMQVAGAEVLVMETIRRLTGCIEPVVFCLDKVGPLGEQLQANGVEVICFNRRPGRDLGVAWRMAREIQKHRIEVLHAHQYTPFFYAALARILAGSNTRLILTEHGRHYPDLVSPMRVAANRLFFDQCADAINACCSFSARALSRVDGFAGKRIEVIENGIEIERYGPASDQTKLRRQLGLDPTRRYAMVVARFHPVKDHASLIAAFARVATVRDDADLLLAGDGPLRSDLEAQVNDLGLGGRVRFLGVRADVPDLLRAVDIFALTSVSEAASLTLLEAMASELPVVVTAVGGNPEIVRHGQEGLLVPRGDVAAIAKALLRLLSDPDSRRQLGRAGRTRVQERYRLEQTIGAYWQLYQSLSRRGNCHQHDPVIDTNTFLPNRQTAG
jgi:glycosyltransferase involved in cell wall biosynthesis